MSSRISKIERTFCRISIAGKGCVGRWRKRGREIVIPVAIKM